MDSPPAIQVRGLTKAYGGVEAVRGLDLEVARGEVFWTVRSERTGKTTTIEILEGLRLRTGGEVQVLGFDPALQVTRSRSDRRLLRADSRLGLIAPGRDASLVVVDGDPLADIGSLEHITSMVLRGERISRSELLEQKKY